MAEVRGWFVCNASNLRFVFCSVCDIKFSCVTEGGGVRGVVACGIAGNRRSVATGVDGLVSTGFGKKSK